MRVTDRSRTETYLACEQERYLRYHYNGLGIVREAESNDANFGLLVHQALALGMAGEPLEAILAPFQQLPEMVSGETPEGLPVSQEYAALGYGFMYAFYSRFHSHLLAHYQPLIIEHEINMPLSPEVLWMARLDGAVRRRRDGMLFVLEWKTSSYPDRLTWQYEYSLQTCMEIASLQHLLQEHVGGMLLIGLDKGVSKEVTDREYEAGLRGHRRLSPFTYAYRKDNGFTVDYSISYKAGWERFPVWTVFSPEAWMDYLEANEPQLLDNVFVTPFPLYVTPKQVDRAITEVLTIEQRISEPAHIPLHNWLNCRNHMGFPGKECPYVSICHHNEWDGYTTRTPHHAYEALITPCADENHFQNG